MIEQQITNTNRRLSFFTRYQMKSLLLFSIIMLIFSFFMILPILTITVGVFDVSENAGIFDNIIFVFENFTYRQSILNAVYVGILTTTISSLVALTLTIIFSRYDFFGKKFFKFLVIFPLISPPFVGAFAISRLLDRNGIITNLLKTFIPGLDELLGGSLWGIVFIQSIHLWPLVYFNISASYSKIDPTQEEQARNLGSKGLNLYRKIILPLITPGFIAGAVLVFIFSIGDIGTPLILNPSEPYAPLIAFSDINQRIIAVNIGAALTLILLILIISLLALLFSMKIVGMREYSSEKVSGLSQSQLIIKADRKKTAIFWILLVSIFSISLLPLFGIFLIAFVDRIKVGEIIPTLWSIDGIPKVLSNPQIISYVINSLIFSILAVVITIIIGVIIAYLVVRKKHLNGINFIMALIGAYVGLIIGAIMANKLPASNFEKNIVMLVSLIIISIIFYFIGKTLNVRSLQVFSTIPFAIPGIVLAVGYIEFFVFTDSVWGLLPPELDIIPIFGEFTKLLRSFFLADTSPNNILTLRFTTFWFMLVIAYAMRRMPYTVLSSVAILRQIHVSLEEMAFNLGSGPIYTFRRITLPLMAAGISAGGILTFVTSFTEVSTSLLIIPKESPISPIMDITPNSKPLTLGIFEEISRGDPTGSLNAGIMGLIQLAVAAIGMTVVIKLLGDKTGQAFGS